MRYWWVNQNQTFRQETAGGYMWSPKRKSNGDRNPFYEFMREVAPGDLILSFADTCIRRIGIAQSWCYESPKPPEFGAAGPQWNNIGWRVDVRYIDPVTQIRPADHMDVLAPLLPRNYAPLQPSGRGLQSVYLTAVPEQMMVALAWLIGPRLQDLMRRSQSTEATAAAATGLWEWEQYLERRVLDDARLETTEREQLVLARRGQGKFKENVRHIEYACRVTRVDRLEHLRASHIKPWRDSDNDERLDAENGLLLTPTIDHLFDRGFISFEDNGRLLVSPAAHRESLHRMGIAEPAAVNVGTFSEGQRRNLDYHRDRIFLQANVRR